MRDCTMKEIGTRISSPKASKYYFMASASAFQHQAAIYTERMTADRSEVYDRRPLTTARNEALVKATNEAPEINVEAQL